MPRGLPWPRAPRRPPQAVGVKIHAHHGIVQIRNAGPNPHGVALQKRLAGLRGAQRHRGRHVGAAAHDHVHLVRVRMKTVCHRQPNQVNARLQIGNAGLQCGVVCKYSGTGAVHLRPKHGDRSVGTGRAGGTVEGRGGGRKNRQGVAARIGHREGVRKRPGVGPRQFAQIQFTAQESNPQYLNTGFKWNARQGFGAPGGPISGSGKGKDGCDGHAVAEELKRPAALRISAGVPKLQLVQPRLSRVHRELQPLSVGRPAHVRSFCGLRLGIHVLVRSEIPQIRPGSVLVGHAAGVPAGERVVVPGRKRAG